MVGALSLGAVNTQQQWPDALIPRVWLLGEVFANALLRQQADRLLREARTETAHYQERLAHLIRVHTVGEMSAAIAHEVNQPLMAIKNYALAALRRLQEGSAPPEKQQELLDKIVLQATRAGDVIHRLRSLGRKHEVEAQTLDLNHLVADKHKLVEMDCQMARHPPGTAAGRGFTAGGRRRHPDPAGDPEIWCATPSRNWSIRSGCAPRFMRRRTSISKPSTRSGRAAWCWTCAWPLR